MNRGKRPHPQHQALRRTKKSRLGAAASTDGDQLYRTLANQLARQRGATNQCAKSVVCSRGSHTGLCNMYNLLTDAEHTRYHRGGGKGYRDGTLDLCRARLDELRRRGKAPTDVPKRLALAPSRMR